MDIASEQPWISVHAWLSEQRMCGENGVRFTGTGQFHPRCKPVARPVCCADGALPIDVACGLQSPPHPARLSQVCRRAPLQQNILSDGRLYLGDANYRSQSPPRQRGVFDNIAACLLPVSPSRAKKAPSTTDEFSDQLRSWIRGNTTLKADTDRHNAWSEYVGEVIKYAHDVGVDAALKYHMQTMRAAQTTPLPRYDPQLHGRRYAEAYFDCIQPVQLAKLAAKAATPRRTQRGASSPSRDSRKRPNPAAASTNTPTTGQIAQAGTLLCSVHGVGGHDSAHCRSLKRPKPSAAAAVSG